MEALQDVVDDDLSVIVSLDRIFDAVENDLLSQEYLGASGVRSIRESDERVLGARSKLPGVLKVLWLFQKVAWVPVCRKHSQSCSCATSKRKSLLFGKGWRKRSTCFRRRVTWHAMRPLSTETGSNG